MTTEYLFTDLFIASAKKNFDHILFEHTFDSEQGSFIGAVAHYSRTVKKLLVVVSTTVVDSLFPIIQFGSAITTIINPSAGITGFANKGFRDLRDISKARDFGLNVYEPIYQEQLPNLLGATTGSSYIRLNEHTLRQDQLPKLTYTDADDMQISFQQQGYSGSNGTIIGFGSLLLETLHAATSLQEQGNAMDVFSSTTLFFSLGAELKESISRTENLIIIIDQHVGSLYEYWVKHLLLAAGLSSAKISFITPYYQNIASTSIEYMYEQAKIDSFSIKERILSN